MVIGPDRSCSCNRPVGITGDNCEMTPCNPHDQCQNDDMCSFNIVNNAVDFNCACKPGFTGILCQNSM